MDDIQESELRKINEIKNYKNKIKPDKKNESKNFKETEKEQFDNEIMTTQIELLNKKETNTPINELNKQSSEKDNIKEEDKMDTNKKSENFYKKTKKLAGTLWNYVNIANYFPKTEYKEYRNCNGDWVKIPVKKIPLKKKNK